MEARESSARKRVESESAAHEMGQGVFNTPERYFEDVSWSPAP